ncbi:hypothetical protein [Bradyrhizobium sp. dw_411]|uniref:hypothetical protein n=1 Tax=Bradyrhizobium sp. dw_411 TaxID=2720082 RepID=UPI001BD17603|nr:hypothetical protein [Bradyrhizobium sp. dw_411]
MPVNERSLSRKSSIRLPVLSETALIAIIAVAFLALHILAGVIFLKTSTATPQQEAVPALYD